MSDETKAPDDEIEAAPVPAEAATDVETPSPQEVPVPQAAPSSSYREEGRIYRASGRVGYHGSVWHVTTNRYGRSRVKAETQAEAERLYRDIKQVPEGEKLKDIASTKVR